MNIRRIRIVGLIGVVLGMALAGRAAILGTIPEEDPDPYGPDSAQSAEWENPLRLWSIREAGRRIAPLQAAKSKPQPGEWLDRHREARQSFEDYRAGNPNRRSRRLTTLYIQPWGEFAGRRSGLIDESAELLGRFYGLPVEKLTPLSLDGIPKYARRMRSDWDAERISTAYIFDVLRQRRPKNAVAILAVTTADLSPEEGGRWVFGQASLIDRVGVCSLFRQGDPDKDFTTSLRRTVKTALHETGHMLGLAHCVAYECSMNGSGSRAEADSRPLWFCHECEMKVWWACALDPAERYVKLIAFAKTHGLDREAAFWDASLRALEGPAPR